MHLGLWTPARGDVFGGLAAMLVAFPSAIAFGIIASAPLGPFYLPQGTIAGILGVVALGLVTPLVGGAPRLISAPCAPTAAMLAAFAVEFGKTVPDPGTILTLLALTSILAALIQLLFGLLGGGHFIKYIPYPVVAGYMSGVGLLIIQSQLSKLLGLPPGDGRAALVPTLWNPQAVAIALAAMAAMLLSPRFSKRLPAPIVALLAGVLAYAALALVDPALTRLAGNPLVIGAAQGGGLGAAALLHALLDRWQPLDGVRLEHLSLIVVPALMLAVLLSIDTLKTCLVMDAVTRERHDSNRVLAGQGIGNLSASLLGGMPGAGTLGATLVNINAGGSTRHSGLLAGLFALLAALLLGGLVVWLPLAALAGILCVIGFRLIDWHSFRLLQQRGTLLDFAVIAAVTGTALASNLMAAAGVGVGLAILLFVREQIRASVVRRRISGNRMFSKKQRLPAQRAWLEREGQATTVFELHGALFFGTTDQLLNEIARHAATCRYLILDLRRVTSADFTAVHLLQQIAERLAERGARLLLSGIPDQVRTYFAEAGLLAADTPVRPYDRLDDALEWAEERLLEAAGLGEAGTEPPLSLNAIQLFAGVSHDTLSDLEKFVHTREYPAGARIFASGEQGDELFLIRRGDVRIDLPLAGRGPYHIASFGRGDFFGEMAFLDRSPRSADALAATPAELFVISRDDFDQATAQHPRTASVVATRLALALAERLRQTNAELRALEEA